MKVLVTGGCGFLGSHICEYYIKEGNDVVVLDNLTKYELNRTGYNIEKTRNYNLQYLKRMGVDVIVGDVSKEEDVEYAATNCDFIAHTAAQPSMTISIENLPLDFSTNVIGTLNILESARRNDIPIVNCSSVHVYGNNINKSLIEEYTRFKRIPESINENDKIMQGTVTPLHASKLSSEFYTNAYIDSYGLKAANFRLSGMYGERQFGGEDHGWIANFIIRTLLKQQITVFGSDKQVRDILYSYDAVRAFDAFYKNQKSGTYNIGGGSENIISIQECLRFIREETNIYQNITYEPMRLGDLWYFVSDISKAKKNLDWSPRICNEVGLSQIINWLNTNKNLLQ